MKPVWFKRLIIHGSLVVGSRFYGIYASVNSRCAHPTGHYFFLPKFRWGGDEGKGQMPHPLWYCRIPF